MNTKTQAELEGALAGTEQRCRDLEQQLQELREHVELAEDLHTIAVNVRHIAHVHLICLTLWLLSAAWWFFIA